MTAIAVCADAAHLPLADNSVDLIVTSPPYFALRSYQDGGAHYDGQIGSETTPDKYLDTMVDCIREWMRVIKPCGSMFINMGDKYAGGQARSNWASAPLDGGRGRLPELSQCQATAPSVRFGCPSKSLMGVPWRLALRCIDDLGLILRAEIIWSKPNGLPEPVTDRVRRSHEQIFHFTLQPRYYSAVDEVREPHIRGDMQNQVQRGHSRRVGHGNNGFGFTEDFVRDYNPLGKLPGSVWTIPSAPLKLPAHLGVDHFAAYPPDLVRPIVLGWSPPGICVVCGEGRRPVSQVDWNRVPHRMEWRRTREPTEHERVASGALFRKWRGHHNRRDFVPYLPNYKNAESVTAQVSNWELGKNVPMPDDIKRLEPLLGPPPAPLREIVGEMGHVPVAIWETPDTDIAGRNRTTKPRNLTRSDYQRITGYVCACPTPTPTAPTHPSVVLDPFGGTGTTALVANAHGRVGVSVDLSHDYCRVAQWRTHDPGERARAMKVERPPEQLDGQLGMFEELA